MDTIFSDAFSNKEAQALRREIDGLELQANNLALSQRNRARQEAEDKLEDERDENAIISADLTLGATNRDEREAARNFTEIMIRSGKLTRAAFNFSKSLSEQATEDRDDRSSFILETMLTGGFDLGEVRDSVIKAFGNDLIRSETARSLLKRIRERKQRITADPAFRSQLKDADALLDANFGKDLEGKLLPREEAVLKRDTAIDMHNRIFVKGEPPIQAARAALAKFIGRSRALKSVPGVSIENQNDLEKGGIQLRALRKRRLISKREYLRRLNLLKQKVKATESEQIKFESPRDVGKAK